MLIAPENYLGPLTVMPATSSAGQSQSGYTPQWNQKKYDHTESYHRQHRKDVCAVLALDGNNKLSIFGKPAALRSYTSKYSKADTKNLSATRAGINVNHDRRYHHSCISMAWLSDFLSVSSTVHDARGVLPLIKGVKFLLKKERYDLIDEILTSFDFNQFNEYSIAAFFRSSFPAKDKLKHWRFGIYRASNVLTNKNIDVSEVLSGL